MEFIHQKEEDAKAKMVKAMDKMEKKVDALSGKQIKRGHAKLCVLSPPRLPAPHQPSRLFPAAVPLVGTNWG